MKVLLQEGKLVSTLQLLIDGSPSDPIAVLIHGVACFLLGILGICDESDTVVTQVRKRPGPDSFLDKMAQVGKSHSYQSAAGNACPVASDPEDLQIFNAFTSIYRKHEAAIGRHVAQFEDIQGWVQRNNWLISCLVLTVFEPSCS